MTAVAAARVPATRHALPPVSAVADRTAPALAQALAAVALAAREPVKVAALAAAPAARAAAAEVVPADVKPHARYNAAIRGASEPALDCVQTAARPPAKRPAGIAVQTASALVSEV